MSNLPTREQANGVLLLRHVSPDERALAWPVVQSYVDGVLMTREEFIDSLDMEAAATRRLGGWDSPNAPAAPGWCMDDARAIIEAALRKEANDEV